jgi:hypothetical protein
MRVIVRRRSRVSADPETTEALAILDRYKAMLEALADAGDRWAPERLHTLWWARHDIEQWGMDGLSRLRVQGYAREVDRLTGVAPAQVRPAQYWVNGPPDG